MVTRTPIYCPVCSQKLVEREEGGRLRPVCDQCGYVHYINPVPGVGVLIEMDGGVVLVQRGHPPHAGEWALPSGFVEADESAEEAAIREAEEETGLKIELIEMAGINSFPEGPPVSGIMIFYRARPVSGELRAGDDAADVRVFAPQDVPRLPFRTHREMIAVWQERQQQPDAPRAPLPEMRIRSYVPADADEVIALLALIPANRGLSDDDWQRIELRLREGFGVEVFVAETGETPSLIIGCVTFGVVRNLTYNIGLVGNMAVLPTYQRRGVGAKLLEAVMRRADQLGLRQLLVDKTRANDQARAFYAALGFNDIDLMSLRLR